MREERHAWAAWDRLDGLFFDGLCADHRRVRAEEGEGVKVAGFALEIDMIFMSKSK
jgi:hypothetical protein